MVWGGEAVRAAVREGSSNAGLVGDLFVEFLCHLQPI